MKLKHVLLAAMPAFALFVCSCNESKEETQLKPLEEISFSDSLVIDETVISQDITVCYPAKDDTTTIADSLRRYYALQLRALREPFLSDLDDTDPLPDFSGDLKDGKALLDYYAKAGFKSMCETSEQGIADTKAYNAIEGEDEKIPGSLFANNNEVVFSEEENNELYVTLCCAQYTYTGGAHPNSYVFYTTFDKADGRQMGYNLVDTVAHNAELKALIKEGMKEYFAEMMEEENVDKDMTDEQLAEFVWWRNESSGSMSLNVEFPATEPALSEKGILFLYQSYEAAAYAFGRPCILVPYDKIKSCMTPDGLRLAGLTK